MCEIDPRIRLLYYLVFKEDVKRDPEVQVVYVSFLIRDTMKDNFLGGTPSKAKELSLQTIANDL